MLEFLEFPLSLVAGSLIVFAQLVYIRQVIKKQVTPSVLSWIGWAIFIGTSFASQLIGVGWNWSLTGLLFSTMGCTAISFYAIYSNNFSLKKFDWIYLVAGLICILLYLVFVDPWITTIFAIAADFLLGIPTLLKAIRYPQTEKSRAWNIALISWSLTLIICTNNELIYVVFPLYLFLFNGTMSLLTRRKEVNLKSFPS